MLGLSSTELFIVGIIALLIFGKRLPEVARSLGKGIVEFKKGMSGIEDEIHGKSSVSQSRVASQPSRPQVEDEERKWDAPKFEPPTTAPQHAETNVG